MSATITLKRPENQQRDFGANDRGDTGGARRERRHSPRARRDHHRLGEGVLRGDGSGRPCDRSRDSRPTQNIADSSAAWPKASVSHLRLSEADYRGSERRGDRRRSRNRNARRYHARGAGSEVRLHGGEIGFIPAWCPYFYADRSAKSRRRLLITGRIMDAAGGAPTGPRLPKSCRPRN